MATAPQSLIDSLVRWCQSYQGLPLAESLVPGTTATERRCLAAVGGLARVVAGDRSADWPKKLREWTASAPEPPPILCEQVIRELGNESNLLAVLYQRLVSGRNRRHLGTFFTPPAVVMFLLDRAESLIGYPSVVVDPGAGVGAITIAARLRWPRAQVLAIDINLVTLGLLAAHFAARNIQSVDYIHGDYLDWILHTSPTTSGSRLIIGNPPYTRHQELPNKISPEHKDALHELVPSGLSSLSAYFLAASLMSLRDQDSLVFVLPGNWTESRYGFNLRRHIWSDLRREIEMFPFPLEEQVFPDALVTAMILAVGPRRATVAPFSVSASRLNGASVVTQPPRSFKRLEPLPQTFGKWLWPRENNIHSDSDGWVSLGDVARVRRGVATGDNSFFFLTDEQKRQLPEGATVRALVRIAQVQGEVLDVATHDEIGSQGGNRWLLSIVDDGLTNDLSVRALLDTGESSGVHQRHLSASRKPWYRVEKVDPPQILVGSMTRGRLRAVANQASVVPSNSIYGIYLNIEQAVVLRLVRWLNSPAGQSSLLSVGRSYAGNLHKIEPKDLLSIRVPPFELLNSDDDSILV